MKKNIIDRGKSVKTTLKILDRDPWLTPYKNYLNLIMDGYRQKKSDLLKKGESLRDFANGHLYFGFHRLDKGWVYREWAPAADSLYLIGDFNNWHPYSHPLKSLGNGTWEIFISENDGLSHGSKVKVLVIHQGQSQDRIPLYTNKVIQDKRTLDFSGQVWSPPKPYEWKYSYRRNSKDPLLIYEAHIGMALEKESIGSYREFAHHVLPRIKKLGYNTLQLMAIMEHPYYGSFGYHVSNFFAASSWFGTPEDLKFLIDSAHGMGIGVIMDLVHSHSVKNFAEGINSFDGTIEQFFHQGHQGYHKLWDSMLFNYGKNEVIHFLLSNIKFWLEEFRFDGFRFDGVTSMIYKDHGLGKVFDNYDKYYSPNTDIDALNYLQLANELIKEINPSAITIAEEVSGFPGMALPIEEGGIGFDYRLAMGMADFWIKALKLKDEDWNMDGLYHELTTHRPGEKRIAYAESHDQSLVGDKTLIFRMADKEMYWHMNRDSENIIIDRAIALHKMIRLITISTGSEGYLNFMGNEFGHPEWIDFPREGNNWSFAHCQRKWSLVDNPLLRYSELNNFDSSMINFIKSNNLMGGEVKCLWINNNKKIIAFKKNHYLWVFNFHPENSYKKFQLPIHSEGTFQVVLDTDREEFGGFNRIDSKILYKVKYLSKISKDRGIEFYLPCRCGIVFKKVSTNE